MRFDGRRIVTKIYNVWDKRSTGIKEKCLMNTDGDYIGIETGTKYLKTDHYHSPQVSAIIVGVDNKNNTGMYHLHGDEDTEENKKSWKQKYIGCEVTVEAAHWCGKHRIYRCLELKDYFSDTEVRIKENT